MKLKVENGELKITFDLPFSIHMGIYISDGRIVVQGWVYIVFFARACIFNHIKIMVFQKWAG